MIERTKAHVDVILYKEDWDYLVDNFKSASEKVRELVSAAVLEMRQGENDKATNGEETPEMPPEETKEQIWERLKGFILEMREVIKDAQVENPSFTVDDLPLLPMQAKYVKMPLDELKKWIRGDYAGTETKQ